MIHKLLNITRPLIIPDTETTGVNLADARIIEIGFQLWTAQGLTKEWRSLINPGVRIPEELTKIHGISNENLLLCTRCNRPEIEHIPLDQDCPEFHPVPTFKNLAASITKGFSDCDFAGKNCRFDLRMIAAEMVRAGVTWSYAGARIIDADRLEQIGEPRTLSHLYKKHTGKDAVDAHQALSDVRMTTEIIECQLQKYEVLPRDLDALHEAQWPGWIDPEGRFKFINGVATATFGKWAGKPMKTIEPGYWDWLLKKSDFSEDVKALARQAKLRQFPTPKENGA